MDVDVIGQSVNGRAMYSVVINELRTAASGATTWLARRPVG